MSLRVAAGDVAIYYNQLVIGLLRAARSDNRKFSHSLFRGNDELLGPLAVTRWAIPRTG